MRGLVLAALIATGCGAPGGSDGGAGGGSGGSGGAGGAGGAGGSGGGGASTQEQAWVAAHNSHRASTTPAPSPALADVTWDATVAASAQAWADRCEFRHNTTSGYGENLYASGGAANDTPASVVADWVSERADYTYSTNTCAAGKACGHYTQVVWRSSVRIGCAQKTCTTGSPFGSGPWNFMLCEYDPPGNFVGQRPY